MSEFVQGDSPEELKPEVQAYLHFATSTLIRAGIATRFNYMEQDDLATSERIFEPLREYHEKAEGLEPVNDYDPRFIRAFHDADLPLAIWSPNDKHYSAVKVDSRGHIYMAAFVPLFMRKSNGSLWVLNGTTQEVVDAGLQLAEMQKELGWQPVHDSDDRPKELHN